MFARRSFMLCVLLAGLLLGWLGGCQSPKVAPRAIIDKQPVHFVGRTFDPPSPPSDMPPLAPGEEAECDSNFLSNASVGGQVEKINATRAFVTITQINVQLQLDVTIWVPANVAPHVVEHEEGHRQIAEHYYQTADDLAQRIAAPYMGEKVEVTGDDLSAESTKIFQQVANQITEKYNKQLSPGPAQLLYDSITDHGRNEVLVKDAVASAIKNLDAESPQPAAHPGN